MLEERGLNKDDYIITEQAPDDAIIVQGYFDGIHLECSFEKRVMRECTLNQRISKLHLKTLIGETAYTTLMDWSDLYPEHVIEFSYYDKPVGTLSNNLIIWEIRKY